ncbi:MAG: hypothetical protein AAF467_15810 [Actinomycetota bacterium]
MEAREWQTPGEWPTWLYGSEYDRLLALARRRLIGYEHLAEDVLSRAVIKWTSVPADRRGIARIEQIIKSEAHSVRRSENRARVRDTRSVTDAAFVARRDLEDQADLDLARLRLDLAVLCKQHNVVPTTVDVEVLEFLFAGCSLAETARILEMPRYDIRRCRDRWKRLIRLMQ